MTNYQQTESSFKNEKYQYEKPPEQKGQEKPAVELMGSHFMLVRQG